MDIKIEGEGNQILIEETVNLNNSSIRIQGNYNRVYIGRTAYMVRVHIRFPDNAEKFCDNREVFIGKNCYIGQLVVNCGDDNHKVYIGERCALSDNISLRTVDGHTIYNSDTFDVLNDGDGSIIIGEHVWLGSGVRFLKGSGVGAHSTVGAGSIVTKKYTEERIILGGVPAKKIKDNINWNFINTAGVKERMASPLENSEFIEELIKDNIK